MLVGQLGVQLLVAWCTAHCLLPPRYVPYVRDSKRAMDEYISEIFMGGRSTIAVHNTCEDSLLAAPIILDLVILAELMGRIQFGKVSSAADTAVLAPLFWYPEGWPAAQLQQSQLASRGRMHTKWAHCMMESCHGI